MPPVIQLLVKISVVKEVVGRHLLILITRKVSLDNLLPGESKGLQLLLKETVRQVFFFGEKYRKRTLSIAARSSWVTLNTWVPGGMGPPSSSSAGSSPADWRISWMTCSGCAPSCCNNPGFVAAICCNNACVIAGFWDMT